MRKTPAVEASIRLISISCATRTREEGSTTRSASTSDGMTMPHSGGHYIAASCLTRRCIAKMSWTPTPALEILTVMSFVGQPVERAVLFHAPRIQERLGFDLNNPGSARRRFRAIFASLIASRLVQEVDKGSRRTAEHSGAMPFTSASNPRFGTGTGFRSRIRSCRPHTICRCIVHSPRTERCRKPACTTISAGLSTGWSVPTRTLRSTGRGPGAIYLSPMSWRRFVPQSRLFAGSIPHRRCCRWIGAIG